MTRDEHGGNSTQSDLIRTAKLIAGAIMVTGAVALMMFRAFDDWLVRTVLIVGVAALFEGWSNVTLAGIVRHVLDWYRSEYGRQWNRSRRVNPPTDSASEHHG